ncbi:MAG TPA: DNA-directed RNA polymerase subunit A'' [Thermoplasmata archaeon]|nr:DNA-directed RNA polymerase subunit A'' [Thermoplasmata archaeon]
MPSRSRRAPPRRTARKKKKGEPDTPKEKIELTSAVVNKYTGAYTKTEKELIESLAGEKRLLPYAIIQKVARTFRTAKLTPQEKRRIVDEALKIYEQRMVDPYEAAGIIAAQSIGEPGTQMSLASDERIVVRSTGAIQVVPIGEFVDRHMVLRETRREGDTEWCDLPEGAGLEVPSLDGGGKVSWRPLRAVSRHWYRRHLVRIRTKSGREIVATPNHSFVTRRHGSIVPVRADSLKVGSMIPLVRNLAIPPGDEALELSGILSKEEFWFGSEVAKARALGDSWRDGFGKSYVVPSGPEQLGNQLRGRSNKEYREGFVYTFQSHGRVEIPERLPLDSTLGWLVGAYLSEGSAQRYHVNISNTDPRFQERTREFARQFEIGMSEHDNDRGFALGHDIHLQSALLSRLLTGTCGKGSAEKHVPGFAFGAPDAFVASLLRAYFDGDGNVTNTRKAIRASSRSRELIEGIALLLSRFGILASLGQVGDDEFTLWVPARFAPRFRDSIGFESARKAAALAKLCRPSKARYTYDALDMVGGFGDILVDTARSLGFPTREVQSATRRQRIGRATLARWVARFEARSAERGIDVKERLTRLRSLLDEDVSWDEIEAVEDAGPTSDPVYDLTVPGTETFVTGRGLVTHNTMRTFHYAGVAEMNVTLGLPRLIEIVDARRMPSTPLMEVHPIPAIREDLEKVRQLALELETTRLRDVARIITDVNELVVTVESDIEQIKSKGLTIDDVQLVISKIKIGKVDVERRGNKLIVRPQEPNFRKLLLVSEAVTALKVKGIDAIERAIIRKIDTGYVIFTEGSNFARIMEHPLVDRTKTSTNSIEEIFQVLGIEAARAAVIREARNTLEEQGLIVDIRHLMLVADIMTNDGEVRAVGRHGISGKKFSVLARAAFEITAQHLLNAGIRGETDTLDGVAENIIIGQPVTLGTGAVTLEYAPPKLKK